jgi:haloalkane dehalogenase
VSTAKSGRSVTIRRVARDAGEIAVADYDGDEPAIVAMHGFPDRRSIYEPLAECLAGRRVLAFDFLGWGDSDKPLDHTYSAASLEADLDAVVSELTTDAVDLVAHDASGPTAINWALRNPQRTNRLLLLNTYYHEQRNPLRLPELIELFANPATQRLTTTLANDHGLLLLAFAWQGLDFRARHEPRAGRLADDYQENGLNPEIMSWLEQFTSTPSSIPAFLGLAADVRRSIRQNNATVDALRAFERPVLVAFGEHDPYLSPSVARAIAGLFPSPRLELLDAGHWPQLELPDRVAEMLLDRAFGTT